MTKISPLTNTLFILVAIVSCLISQSLAALSDKQLCYDPNCSEVISLAKTILAYRANDREVMSFGINEDVKVFSKGAGKRIDLWGVEIKGKRGFAPKTFLNEYKVLQRILLHEVPVYKFTDETKDKVLTKAEKVHKIHPLLKDKLPRDINETLSPSAKSLDKSVQEKNVESKRLESTEEIHSSVEDNLSYSDNSEALSAQSLDKTVAEFEAINVDSISPSYEVIDGTTFYFESKPSVQQKSTEAMHATVLPNEQVSLPPTNLKTDSDNNDDKTVSMNKKEKQHDITDAKSQPEEIKLSVDISEEINTKTLLGNSEVISPVVDTVGEDDTLSHDVSGKSKDQLSKDLERSSEGKLMDNSAEKIAEYKKEELTETIEDEGIFASFARKFNILSDSLETATTEGTTTSPNANDVSTSEVIIESKTIVEENIPATEASLDVDSGITSKRDIEIQQKVIDESIRGTRISDEKVKLEEETIAVRLEDTASRDVPLSNNFVREDAYKSAEKLSIASSVLADNSPTFNEADVNSHAENVKMQETSEEEKVIENIETEEVIASLGEGSTVSPEVQETTVSITAQSNDDIEQTSPESAKASLEVTKKDVHGDTVAQVGEVTAVNETSETSNLPSTVENSVEIRKDIIKEASLDNSTVGKSTVIIDDILNRDAADVQLNAKSIVHSNVNKNDHLVYDASSGNVPVESDEFSNGIESSVVGPKQSADSSQKNMISEKKWTPDEYLGNRNLASNKDFEHKNVENQIHSFAKGDDKTLLEHGNHISSKDKILPKVEDITRNSEQTHESESTSTLHGIEDNVCSLDHECATEDIIEDTAESLEKAESEEDYMFDAITIDHNYWKTLIYLMVTALTTLVFTLGYYYIENIRRDGQLIAKINKLEKELLVSTKECEVLNENLKSTKEKLRCIEDESFGSNEMVVSLKADLEAAQNTKAELEDQVVMLEKDLESATEAGLELERMLREFLSSNNEVNPLAQSVEGLQARLDAQQIANESLTNALNLKSQEIETLSADLATAKKKCEEYEVELSRVQHELDIQRNFKNNIEETLTDKIHSLEMQVNELSTEKSALYKELRGKEIEVNELVEVINQINSNSLDLEKLYEVSRVKTEAAQLREERNELKMRLSDVEGAHQLLEEHMKLVKEEIAGLSEQCKMAEKEKKDAETRLEVLSKFFKEKEAERQKEEAIWLQKQGEVVSTVERIHTMQNEIQNYKQQTEMLKREIVDQEREYKNQISALETKSHEQWVIARQNERRMEEMRAEAGQLRNRLTLVEKNLNDSDSETKLHRLEANGETATSPLFIGAESSSSPIMFSSGVPPPPPPSYLHCFPAHLPPVLPLASGYVRTSQYDSLSQRPPPLGGRLSSPPPPMPPIHPPAPGGRYENASSPPPPMSPHLLPPFNRHRSPPPPPPFGGDHIPPPPPPGSIVPPPIGTAHAWAEESSPFLRGSGFHPHQREQRTRNHKGSLHSSGESLDKAHHGKV
ncbi:transport and Golgi organization protein 1 isoform X1 [Harpegnathos saltator]|uniref:transport and Golgi organization protein 1 isoform X1 n=1 Tax=Harpegnathos saltator TaxID=610380 RepID=UPI00058DFB91|nr:transport and Golgi organization protein 1 isoform X1 [Harpegnathos saltator]